MLVKSGESKEYDSPEEWDFSQSYILTFLILAEGEECEKKKPLKHTC